MSNLKSARAGVFLGCVSVTISGCATLPASGPTAAQVTRKAKSSGEQLRFRIVNLDAASLAALNTAEAQRVTTAKTMVTLARDSRADLIGPGDVLSISIYELGVSLFSGGGPRVQTSGFDPSARAENFQAIAVDGAGTIQLPYLGRLVVAGRSPEEAQTIIRQALSGKSQDPQVVVAIRQNVANTVYVSGDIGKPGRLELTLGRERLLDAVASAGGAKFTTEDTVVRVFRIDRTVEQRLATIQPGSPDDIVLSPGDRIELIKQPRSYTVFGATQRVSQVDFATSGVSLAEALARVGGPNDGTADPSAVFLFRYDDSFDSQLGAKPVIYRLNMLEPASYFLAQRFAMRDKDVIYIANAAANQPGKLVGIINQLFSPFVTALAITRP